MCPESWRERATKPHVMHSTFHIIHRRRVNVWNNRTSGENLSTKLKRLKWVEWKPSEIDNSHMKWEIKIALMRFDVSDYRIAQRSKRANGKWKMNQKKFLIKALVNFTTFLTFILFLDENLIFAIFHFHISFLSANSKCQNRRQAWLHFTSHRNLACFDIM